VRAEDGVVAALGGLRNVLINGATGTSAADVLMAVAGAFYLVWFVLLGRRLLQLGRAPREV
jgi:hypothetical protein